MSGAWGKRLAVVIGDDNSEIFCDRVFVDFNSDLELFFGLVGKVNKDLLLARLF